MSVDFAELSGKGSKETIQHVNICLQRDSNLQPFATKDGALEHLGSLPDDELFSDI